MTRSSRPSVAAAVLAAIALLMGVSVSAGTAPTAEAQSVMPLSPPGVPQLENAPLYTPTIPGVAAMPVLTYPVIGPAPGRGWGGRRRT